MGISGYTVIKAYICSCKIASAASLHDEFRVPCHTGAASYIYRRNRFKEEGLIPIYILTRERIQADPEAGNPTTTLFPPNDMP